MIYSRILIFGKSHIPAEFSIHDVKFFIWHVELTVKVVNKYLFTFRDAFRFVY